MEDPWANAWGDSSNHVLPEPSPLLAAPSVSVLHDEDDLSAPSWPKDPVGDWGITDLPADQIWSKTEISSTWNAGTSTFDDISLAADQIRTETQDAAGIYSSSSLSLNEEEPWAPPKLEVQEILPRALPHSYPVPIFIPTETLETTNVPKSPSPTSPLPKLTFASSSEDVDVFGSFETGQDDQEKESWTPTNSSFPPISSTDSANWDSAWQAEHGDEKNEQEDAWESARRQRDKRDRHVPPELLACILGQLEELSKDLWEDLGTTSLDINDNLDFEMLGLDPVLTRLSPDDMTLPPTVPFAKTFTMKHMSESLKLTRHNTSTRLSPMAMYLASKGSNSWETAVKARPSVASDDVTPVGWKIVDSATQKETPLDDGKKKVGGIFSFFGRRSHNLSVDSSSKRSASPTTTLAVASNTSTPRAGSPATVESNNLSEQSKTAVSGPPNIVSDAAHMSPSATPTDAAKDEIQPETTQPSTVSRFIGRIVGRSKTRSIDSLALSADDLEFLADVPTSSNTHALKNEDLTNMLETPLPLPPPRPLAPPSRQESPLPKLPPPPSRPARPGSDDLLSSFDPTPILTPRENPVTTNPHCAMPSSKNATSQSSISHAPPLNQLWATLPVKSASSRLPSIHAVDLPKTSSRLTINGSSIKSDVQISKPSAATLPVLAPLMSTAPLKPIQVDDDEFSDFLSSPAVQISQSNSSSRDSVGSSSIIPSIHMPDTHHDDFGEFREALYDLPARKPPPSSGVTATGTMPFTQSETVLTRKGSKKADHSRTLSLLEAAATRGRWLSPPSPIPEALSPPPTSSSATVGTDSRKSDMQTQQALAMSAYSIPDMAADTWRLPPPPSGTLLTPSVISSTPVYPVLTPPSRPEFVAQSSRSPSSAQPGGLSAQDLSFFEGL